MLKELEEVHSTFLKGVSDTIEEMTVTFATTDAAVVTVTSRMSTFTTRDGHWMIMQDQNTALARPKV